ncbi:MAG: hypothetical protein Q9175_004682 [Cornicularia normoerica]
MLSPRTILITGATGKQGGALITSLLASPSASSFNILALTRKTTSASAKALAAKSPKVTLIEGNFNDPHAVFASARKTLTLNRPAISGVFSVQTPVSRNEEKQGKDLVDVALENGVKQFVYSSVERGAGSPATNVPHFAHKHNIENHLMQKSDGGRMDWTILRPVCFMDNLTPDLPGKLFATAWKRTLDSSGKSLQLIHTPDIGVIAAEAFLHPEKYKNQAMSLAGDEITYGEADAIFKDKVGKAMPLTFGPLVGAALWAVKDFGLMFQWFKDEGFASPVEDLRKRYKMTSWVEFVEGKKGDFIGK